MTWRGRWRKVEQILVWPAWGSLAVVFAFFVWNPNFSSQILALLTALLALGMLVGAVVFLVLVYRRWLMTWRGLMLVWGIVAGANAWPLIGGNTSGIYAFLLATGNVALWLILALMMLRRDAGLALGIGALIAFAWSAALANAGLGGPANTLLMLFTEGDTGRIWWFNTIITGLMCIGPLAPFTFGGWVLARLYREFFGRGSI